MAFESVQWSWFTTAAVHEVSLRLFKDTEFEHELLELLPVQTCVCVCLCVCVFGCVCGGVGVCVCVCV